MNKIEKLLDSYKEDIKVPYCPNHSGSDECKESLLGCKERTNCRIKCIVFACQIALMERKCPVSVNELAEYILNELGVENPELIKE